MLRQPTHAQKLASVLQHARRRSRHEAAEVPHASRRDAALAVNTSSDSIRATAGERIAQIAAEGVESR